MLNFVKTFGILKVLKQLKYIKLKKYIMFPIIVIDILLFSFKTFRPYRVVLELVIFIFRNCIYKIRSIYSTIKLKLSLFLRIIHNQIVPRFNNYVYKLLV